MSKSVKIIGIGTGINTITMKGLEAFKASEVIIGATRMLEVCKGYGSAIFETKRVVDEYKSENIKACVDEGKEEHYAVLVSGDTGFYSLASGIVEALLAYEVEVIPGISSVSAMSSRIGIPWQDMKLISCHGRKCNFVDAIRRNKYTFMLTGGNVCEILECLEDKGFGELKAYIGSRLDMEEESVVSGSISELKGGAYDTISVMVVVNDQCDDRVLTGIDDGRFIRGEVPMTKSEVRAVLMSQLAIRPGDICYDYGCGTGSVTVEMALSAYEGHVYAIDKKPEAVSLTQKNIDKFHIGNVTIIEGSAPDDLIAEAPDVAFIGGSTGKIASMIEHLLCVNPKVRIVINAIALETVSESVKVLTNMGIETSVTQVSINKSKQAGSINMMMAQNSVFIIKGEKI